MDIASVLRIISYIGYIFFIIFAVLTVVVFVKYDIRNVFGFLSGHVAAKRIAEIEHSSGNVGNYSQSRVKSNSLFRKNSGKSDSTNRLKTDYLVKNLNNQATEKLDEKKSFHFKSLRKGSEKTEPLEQRTVALQQERTEPLEQRTEVLYQEKTEPLVQKTEVLAQEKTEPLLNDLRSAQNEDTVLLNKSTELSDTFSTEVLSESYETEELFTEVLGIDPNTLSDSFQNDIENEKQKHQAIHKEVASGFIVEKEIVLTHSMDRIPRS